KRDYDSWHQNLQTLHGKRLTVPDIEDFIHAVRESDVNWLCALDAERLKMLLAVAADLLTFCQGESGFLERERSLNQAKNRLLKLTDTIKENPTRLGLGTLYPLFESMIVTCESAM